MVTILVLQFHLKDIFCLQMYTLVTLAHMAHTPDASAQHHIEQLELAIQHLDQLDLDAAVSEGLDRGVDKDDMSSPGAP